MAELEDDTQDEEEEEQKRSSLPFALASFALLLGLGIALFVYQSRRTEQYTTQGLDVDVAPAVETAPTPATEPLETPAAPPRTFGITSNLTAPNPSAGVAPAGPRDRSASGFQEAIWKNERFFRKLTVKYQKKSPVFLQWGKEWMSHPELAKACDEWYAHKSPIKFAYQIASSPNLPKMVLKYSRNQELHAYLREMATSAPKEVVMGLTDYLSKDKNAVALVEKFAKAAGLPPALVAGFTGKKVDQNEVMRQILEQQRQQQGKPVVQQR